MNSFDGVRYLKHPKDEVMVSRIFGVEFARLRASIVRVLDWFKLILRMGWLKPDYERIASATTSSPTAFTG
jgi:hypothetical protein